jgi:hypothetical protein
MVLMNSPLSVNDFLYAYFPELPRQEIFERLTMLEQEYFPHLSWAQAQEQVIWRIVDQYQDHRLNYFWATHKKNPANYQAAA